MNEYSSLCVFTGWPSWHWGLSGWRWLGPRKFVFCSQFSPSPDPYSILHQHLKEFFNNLAVEPFLFTVLTSPVCVCVTSCSSEFKCYWQTSNFTLVGLWPVCDLVCVCSSHNLSLSGKSHFIIAIQKFNCIESSFFWLNCWCLKANMAAGVSCRC